MLGRRMGRPGLLGMAARTAVVAGTATAVSGRVSRRSAQRAEADAAEPPAVEPEAAPASMSVEDQVAKIKALGELKDKGLLTDDEFSTEKAKVLAS
jgi:putative oligomerization/nucleic acid binding protein